MSKVVWFTGLSGSGKTTVANALAEKLRAQGKSVCILDGDDVRQGLNKDLGFSDLDRAENIRRAAEAAKIMIRHDIVVLAAFISPIREWREMAKQIVGKLNFVEVYIAAPLEVCEQRDPKGLYKKARAGALKNLAGVDCPYEPPKAPDVMFSNSSSIDEILNFL